MTATRIKTRCAWAESDPLMRDYHDMEWGVPEHDSRTLWEMLMLEGFQAGLAWITVLRKRDAFRKAFKGFDPAEGGEFTEKDILKLLENPGIIRSRAKIEATIKGAQIFLEMKKSGEDFGAWLWGIAGGKPVPVGGACAGADAGGGGDVEAAEEARLQVCGAGDCVCVHAGCGDGERSQRVLL